jgi:galactose-1-phosphate uridylyltransferase
MLFPNSFPYAQWNWVVVLSEEHFLHLDQFSVEILRDGFLVGQEGIEKLEQVDDNYNYVSINWNYLPQAGGGIIHPHLQVVAEDSPTVSHKNVLEGLKRYRMEGGRQSFWEDFLYEEIRINERYVGKEGDIHFLTSFSPSGILGEILFLFSNKTTIKELTIKDWEDFSEALTKVFKYFKSKSIESFNLSIFSGGGEEVPSWVYGRLCPRIAIPPWNTSDINYFEKLHDEVICAVSPEEICKEIKPFYCKDQSDSHHGKETLGWKERAKGS